MGFQTQRILGKYRSHFFENLQNRFKSKHLVKGLKELVPLIRVTLPDEVMKHQVEKALKDEMEADDGLKDTVSASAILYRNMFIEEDKEVKELEVWEEEMYKALVSWHHTLRNVSGKDKQIDDMLKKHQTDWSHLMLSSLGKIEYYERDIYKEFLTLINAAENQSHDNFMEKLNAMIKREDASYLDYFLIKQENKANLKEIQKQKQVHERTHKLIEMLNKELELEIKKGDSGQFDKILQEIKNLDKAVHEMSEHVDKANKKAHLATRRTILLDLSVLGLSRDLTTKNQKWIKEILMPKQQLEIIDDDIKKEVFEQTDKVIREYSQAIRIILTETDRDIATLKKIEKAK